MAQVPVKIKSNSRRSTKLAISNGINISSFYDSVTLPLAVGNIFALNGYDVSYGVHIHGAEVDIVAIPRGNPFAPNIYLEVTVQKVGVDKYGKDLTKFALIREIESGATCICVSAKGFTPKVAERAKISRIITQTYEKLFAQFEKFGPYVNSVMSNSSIRGLIDTYEEPAFEDKMGIHEATKWLDDWKLSDTTVSRWIVILGEYGTGKTSLTLALQYRWIENYKKDVSNPIPIRIELKNFSRQFDARSLLHHFLDNNGLSHIPIDFAMHLIRSRRIILILDGYDEMAQFLNARDRRACLSALAELSSEGAKGLMTSRPNYFTETEELTVFDALYTTLEKGKYHLSQMDKSFLVQERSIDALIENYILYRKDRSLRDLTQYQTESLVRRKLANDLSGQELILSLLRRIFREEVSGARQSLSGKPVIISFLLDLVEELRQDGADEDVNELTE